MESKIIITFDKKDPKMWSFRCINCNYKQASKTMKEMIKEIEGTK